MNDCADVRTALGVYMLGALDPGERSQVEAHLEGCPACRDELAGMAGLPALLGRVDEAQLEQIAGPPPELLDGLLARAAERRRDGSARWGAWRRARAVGPARRGRVPGAGRRGAGGALLFPSRDGGTVAAPPSATPTGSAVQGERINAADPKTNIKGYVLLHRKAWGTEVELHLAGVPKGSHCRLLVIARDGRRDALGSWYVPYDEGYGEYRGSTMFPRGQLFSFEVVGLDGQPLLTIPT